jgi:hypothetical protein
MKMHTNALGWTVGWEKATDEPTDNGSLVRQPTNRRQRILSVPEMVVFYPFLHTPQTTHNVYVLLYYLQFIVESGVKGFLPEDWI